MIRTFRTKKKAAFVARYERTSEEQEEDDAIDIDQLLKEALSSISQGDKVRSIRPTGEIMEGMITGVNPATGEAAVQYAGTIWTEPAMHTAKTKMSSSGLTKEEDQRLDLVYRDPSGKSKAVIKSVARANGKGAFYKVVDFAGREWRL